MVAPCAFLQGNIQSQRKTHQQCHHYSAQGQPKRTGKNSELVGAEHPLLVQITVHDETDVGIEGPLSPANPAVRVRLQERHQTHPQHGQNHENQQYQGGRCQQQRLTPLFFAHESRWFALFPATAGDAGKGLFMVLMTIPTQSASNSKEAAGTQTAASLPSAKACCTSVPFAAEYGREAGLRQPPCRACHAPCKPNWKPSPGNTRKRSASTLE